MKQKRRSMEEIIPIIRQADGHELDQKALDVAKAFFEAGGKTVREVCREHNVHEVTFHRWKRKYGGLKLTSQTFSLVWCSLDGASPKAASCILKFGPKVWSIFY